MSSDLHQDMIEIMKQYRLPRFDEIPSVGLYLNQVAKYINEYLEPFPEMAITESMISNYVKKRLVSNPIKKQYDREQIAYLIFISFSKAVLSMENLKLLFEMQRGVYGSRHAYNYFCEEFENVMKYVYGIKPVMDVIVKEEAGVKVLCRNTIISLCYKLHLSQSFHEAAEQKIEKKAPQD